MHYVQKGVRFMNPYIWLGIAVALLIVELLTVGLTTIWFAVGALLAMTLAFCGVGLGWQLTVFVVVSTVLLIATRPLVQKYINSKHVKTNVDAIVGMTGRVVEAINGIEGTGAVIVDGKTWSAKAENEMTVIPVDTIVTVREVIGVKLLVK